MRVISKGKGWYTASFSKDININKKNVEGEIINFYKNTELNDFIYFLNYFVLKKLMELGDCEHKDIENFFKYGSKNILNGLNDEIFFKSFYVRKIKRLKFLDTTYCYFDDNEYVIKPEIIDLNRNGLLFIGGRLYEKIDGNLKELDSKLYISLDDLKDITLNGKNRTDCYAFKTSESEEYLYLIEGIEGAENKTSQEIKKYYEDGVKNLTNLYFKNKREEELGCKLEDEKEFKALLKEKIVDDNINIISWLKKKNYMVIANHPSFIIYGFGKDIYDGNPNLYMIHRELKFFEDLKKNKLVWNNPIKLDVKDEGYFYAVTCK